MEKAQALLNRLQQKVYKPVYLLQGTKETYFVDLIAKYIENNVLNEEQKAFNLSILYGKDTDVYELINAAKRFPMMADYQVIVVREAQDLKNIEILEAYVEKPQPTTILVLCYKYKKIDGRKKVFKLIKNKHEYFETGNIYESHVLKWINDSLKRDKYSIDSKASKMLIEFLGNSISPIHKELEKLKQILPLHSTILPSHIEEYVGISKDYNNFELIHAIGTKNSYKAQKIAKYFAQNSKNYPLVLSLSLVFNFFNKILIYHSLSDKSKANASKSLGVSPYFLDDYIIAAKNYTMKDTTRAIELLRVTDAMSKGVNAVTSNSNDLLRSMLVRIIQT